MLRAIELAKLAAKQDEVPVGAVIVQNNKIIGEGFNQNIGLKDPIAHAEIIAIKEACLNLNHHRLDHCDIYISLEPCIMCFGAISMGKIRRIYYAASDSKFGSIERAGLSIFKNNISAYHLPECYSGFGESESKEILKDFFKSKR